MCGGTAPQRQRPACQQGLSPRVRGNRRAPAPRWPPPGSIPACAGEPRRSASGRPASRVYPRVCGGTLECLPWARCAGVYPRVCGGTVLLAIVVASSQGLSPRVRGNRERQCVRAVRHGSIPACAGEPSPPPVFADLREVYPRVCGGTVESRGWCGAAGSIPACAGEPYSARSSASQRRVYPRVCGGTLLRPGNELAAPGLSPRVRGNRIVRRSYAPVAGSIPACAGEPRNATLPRTCPRVYPRVCGGTLRRRQHGGAGSGLSPRVRGNLSGAGPALPRAGSIPACAGEPQPPPNPAGATGVYPRVCGGTWGGYTGRAGETGLSPRVRGNLRHRRAQVIPCGSIPACAGEPDSLSG